MKKSLVALLVAASCSAGVLAQESDYQSAVLPESEPIALSDDIALTANITLASDYRFRGISQTQNNPAFQGGLDLTLPLGFYVGNWNSSVSATQYPNGAGLESDFYAGWKKDVWEGLTVDVGSWNYFYPGATNGTNPNFNTSEVYGGLSYGSLSAKYNQSMTNYFGIANSKNTSYMQADLNQSLGFVTDKLDKLSFVAHYGRTDVANNSTLNYDDYNVGLAYDLNSWIVAGKYYQNGSYGADAKAFNTSTSGRQLYKDAFVVTVTKTF